MTLRGVSGIETCKDPTLVTQSFNPGDRTYYVSDERLRAFRALSPEQRLKWAEEMAHFLRLAKAGRDEAQTSPSVSAPDEKA